MREDYKLNGNTVKIEIEVEKDIAEKLEKMEAHSKLSRSELTNTALKRFISAHKDFLPPSTEKRM
jgi:metal-responsive CopG/Arc/MetJ family transcriptional regulator